MKKLFLFLLLTMCVSNSFAASNVIAGIGEDGARPECDKIAAGNLDFEGSNQQSLNPDVLDASEI